MILLAEALTVNQVVDNRGPIIFTDQTFFYYVTYNKIVIPLLLLYSFYIPYTLPFEKWLLLLYALFIYLHARTWVIYLY